MNCPRRRLVSLVPGMYMLICTKARYMLNLCVLTLQYHEMLTKTLSLQLWPALAEWFGIETAPPLRIPLASFMPKHEKTWKQIREKYALKDIPYDKVCTPDIGTRSFMFQ